MNDKSSPVFIKKGEINDSLIVSRIIDLNPDLLVCYGSSLIKSELLEIFKGKFINVHLGLSPYAEEVEQIFGHLLIMNPRCWAQLLCILTQV